MKRIIDLIYENNHINECGGFDGGSGCGGYSSYSRASRKPQKRKTLSKEEKLDSAKSKFTRGIVDMLKNVKGTSTDRAKKRLEKACEHLCERAQSMDGGEFVMQFAEYIEKF